MKINLGKSEIIHFVGIGGIGMSGLALIMKSLGFKIQGSDINYTKNINHNVVSVNLANHKTIVG